MAKNGKQTGKDYEVGKGKPPVHTRFSSTNQPENNGRPKGSVSIKTELRKLMEVDLPDELNMLTGALESMPVGRKVALQIAVKASQGDLWAIKMAMEHLDGKPAQDVNLGGQGDKNPIIVVASNTDKDLLDSI